MKFYRARVDVVFELPEGWNRHHLTDAVSDLLIEFVESQSGFMGGGVTVDEVDENGDEVPHIDPTRSGRGKNPR